MNVGIRRNIRIGEQPQQQEQQQQNDEPINPLLRHSSALHHATFAAEEVIIQEGEVGDNFYMIYSGTVRSLKRESDIVAADEHYRQRTEVR